MRRPLPTLLALYVAGMALRWAACLLLSQNPFVMPDEALYANIARSLVSGTGVTLRGQPLTYTNLLYPLLISPAWALGVPGGPFRTVQMMNCLMMNLAVFPAWRIARGFSKDDRAAYAVAALSILLPDMALTARIMAESAEYPLFLLTGLLMFRHIEGRAAGIGHGALIAACAFLLAQVKGGLVALAAAYALIVTWGAAQEKNRGEWLHLLAFVLSYAALWGLSRLGIALLPGVDYSNPTIYQTQAQPPTIEHLKRTLTGLLLYLYFIPVAFGVFPLLLPATGIRLYPQAQRRQIALMLLALAAIAAGACYLFFDAEAPANAFAGRIHIRYVFPFLPVFAAFLCSPALDDLRPGVALKASLGFLLAMTVTVSFSTLLSGRRYPVDALSLSAVIHDDPALNMRSLCQIAMVTFCAAVYALVQARGWGRAAKTIVAACMLAGALVNNALGYDLNRWNDSPALAADSTEAARLLRGKSTLLAPESGLYFDNTLSVLDIAMQDAPRMVLLDDLCENLGPYGAYVAFPPPKYWMENPADTLPPVDAVVLNGGAFYRVVPAQGAAVRATANNTYGVVTLTKGGRLFHSALGGVDVDGLPGSRAALYVYDETLLKSGKIRVYLQVRSGVPSRLALTSGAESFAFDLDQSSDWVYADFHIPDRATRLKVSVAALSGSPDILTYKVQ